MVPALYAQDRGFVKSVIERSVAAGSNVLVFTVDLPTPGRRYSEVHGGMEKDPTLLGMLGSSLKARRTPAGLSISLAKAGH